jgi:hypothetical protein
MDCHMLKKAEFDAAVKLEAEQWGLQTRVKRAGEDFQAGENEASDVSFFLSMATGSIDCHRRPQTGKPKC